ncbi:MAG: hypothetical protein KJ070_20930 [Verrucomicrobia bacterium]|nr:hypothetical protein [Verrucomicrobiota bacterium]
MLTALKVRLARLIVRPFPRRYRVTPRQNPWVFRRGLLRDIRAELRGLPNASPDWRAASDATTLRGNHA